MKSPSVYLLLGVCVLLLSALTVSAVFAYLPPFPPKRSFFHLVVIAPYCVSTLLMVSLHKRVRRGRPAVVCMEMAPLDRAERVNEDYDDITADVTTEHDF